jgi:serine/threonine-protein kinase
MILGRYRIVEQIGSGGMGEVFRALAEGMHGFAKPVVVKQIRSTISAQADTVKRFINEGKVAMNLCHRNVVQVLDLGFHGDRYYMVFEYVNGRDLREILAQCEKSGRRPLPELSLYVATEVLRGLDYAHRAVDDKGEWLGIVHRDVTPANVLCSFEGEVKLADFGLARSFQIATDPGGAIIGTLRFMSPEQAVAGPIDQRSDLFSVGVILYLLLVGVHPFGGGEGLLERIVRADFVPPLLHDAELRPELEDVLRRAMARRPEDRFPTASSMLEALEDVQRLSAVATCTDLRSFLRSLYPTDNREAANTLATAAEVQPCSGAEIADRTSPETPRARELMPRGPAAPLQPSGLAREPAEQPALSADVPTLADGEPGTGEEEAEVGVVVRDRLQALRLEVTAPMSPVVAGPPPAAPERDAAHPRARRWVAVGIGAAILVGAASLLWPRGAATPSSPVGGADRGPPRSRRELSVSDLAASPEPTPERSTSLGHSRDAARPRRPAARPGWVRIITQPAYAEVFVRGRKLDDTPCRVRLPAGTHTVTLVNKGLGRTVIRRVEVKPEEETRLVVDDFR